MRSGNRGAAMADRATLRKDVGQLLVVGLESLALTGSERAWLRLLQPAGVILFRRNIEAASQTVDLLRQATEAAGAPLLRCVDLEGGLVDRFRDLIAPMPSAASVAATGKAALYRKHGALIGRSTRRLGLNITFAPVIDLALPVSKDVMRTRVVSDNPAEVVRYARSFLAGLQGERVLGCLKHFPGLGGGTLDSHHATPVIERTAKELYEADLLPYRELAPAAPMVMVSHASYPQASRDPNPASISRYWITDMLRKRIGYRGLIISDDMEMGGILTQTSIEDASIAAIAAGTDLIEICKDPALVLAAYEALLTRAEKSSAFRRRVETAARKIRSHKQRLLDRRPLRAPSTAEIENLRRDILTFSATVEKSS